MEDADGVLNELVLLRHAGLTDHFDFALEGARTYTADLITQPTALAPAYSLRDARGDQIGQVVLPSILQDVELHLLDWITRWDHAQSVNRLR